jgi:Uma2 family endonuclease
MPEPTWEIAHLFPPQGTWSEEEYLALNANRLVEFSQGNVEVLPMPTTSHQFIALFLYRILEAFASARGLGATVAAPLRVRLWAGKYREPDVVFLLRQHEERIHEQYWDGADLVMEVVSDDDRRRDVETKRREYARAGIPEYWLVDPQDGKITVLRLATKRYVIHGEFSKGATAVSALLPGFSVDVSEALAKGSAGALARKSKRKPQA